MQRIVLFSVLFYFVSGCHGAAGSNSYTSQNDRGKELYYAKCGACHRLYAPQEFTATQWDSILPRMERKAALTKAHIELLKEYLRNETTATP